MAVTHTAKLFKFVFQWVTNGNQKKKLTPDVSIISCLLLRKNTEIWPWDFRKITHQQKTERSLTVAYLTLQVF